MKVKRAEPQKIFRVRKKGKTRGRPSKVEIAAGLFYSHIYEKYRKEIEKAYMDSIIYGVGVLKVKP